MERSDWHLYFFKERITPAKMHCNETIDDCSFWFGGHTSNVYESITIGDGGCGNVQPAGTKLFLRATDDVILHGNFKVPLGSELIIETGNICY